MTPRTSRLKDAEAEVVVHAAISQAKCLDASLATRELSKLIPAVEEGVALARSAAQVTVSRRPSSPSTRSVSNAFTYRRSEGVIEPLITRTLLAAGIDTTVYDRPA